MHLDPAVRLVCLSATVSNAEEVAAWIETVRGPDHRGDRGAAARHPGAPLPGRRAGERHGAPAADVRLRAGSARAQPRGRPARRPTAARRQRPARRNGGGGGGRPRRRGRGCAPRAGSRWSSASTPRTCCRRSCSCSAAPAATRRCSSASPPGCGSPTPDERAQLRAIADAHTRGLAPDDLEVLRHGEWLAGLEAGFAAHHAGHGAADEGGGRGGVRRRAWRRSCSRPRRSRSASTCRRGRSSSRSCRSSPASATSSSRRASTRSSPGAPGRRGHRRARLRGGAVEPVRALRPGRVARVTPHRRAHLGVPPDLQHGGQPGAPVLEVRGAPPPQPVVRAVPRRP